MARTLILCPTYNHADTLFMSIASARVQTDPDWEMHVILDGAPERTIEVVEAICDADARIVYTSHPKAKRHGEEYRDGPIRASDAEFVVHLGDDDIWAPSHLASMTGMMQQADWVNEAALAIGGDGAGSWIPFNAGVAAMRRAAIDCDAPIPGLNAVGYRREAYLRLATGWTSTPLSEGPSDRAMWAKFFAAGDLSVASTAASTVFRLPSGAPRRHAASPAARVAELGPILAASAAPGRIRRLIAGATVLNQAARLFDLAGTAQVASLADAMRQVGFVTADPGADFDVATDGAPLRLPLSISQRSQIEAAHAATRHYIAEHPMASRHEVWLQANWPAWIGLIRTLQDNSLAAALRGADHFEAVLGAGVEAASLRANLLSYGLEFDVAEQALAECERQWPDHPRTRHARAELAAARNPGPHQPWLHRQYKRKALDIAKP